MNLKYSLFFLGCSFIYCQFCFSGIDAESEPYNIAQGKPTQQGPNTYCGGYQFSCHHSGLAVDNDLGQNVSDGNCAHTKGRAGQGSWWRVDFQGKYYLSYIRILRSNVNICCYGDRMTGITIKDLHDSHTIYNASDAGIFGNRTDVSATIPGQLRDTQFAGIEISVDGPFLTLCEVQVFLDMTRHCIVPSLQNGIITEQNQSEAPEVVELNHVLMYKCNTGFTPFLQTELRCTADGLRDSTYNAPSCSVTNCGVPSQKPNGIWETRASNCLRYGCSYNLVCNRGYTANISGQITTTCGSNGQWTELNGSCKAKECGKLSQVPNGFWSQFPSNPSTVCLHYGCYYNLICSTGYTVNASGSATVTCNERGQWTIPRAHCQAVQCSAPNTITNGSYFKVLTNGLLEEMLSMPNKFALDTKLRIKCNFGFRLPDENKDTRICLEDETWSEEEPKCIEISFSNENQNHLRGSGGLTALTGGIIGAGTVLFLMFIAAAVFLLLRRMRNQRHTDSVYETTVSVDGERRYSTLVKTDRFSDNGEPTVVPDRAPDNDVEMYEEIGGTKVHENPKV